MYWRSCYILFWQNTLLAGGGCLAPEQLNSSLACREDKWSLSLPVPVSFLPDWIFHRALSFRLSKAFFSTGRHTGRQAREKTDRPGNTKGGSITVLLTSCLTGLDVSVLQIRTKIVSCRTADSKLVKQEVNGTVILPLLVFPGQTDWRTNGQPDKFMNRQPVSGSKPYKLADRF
jgi:hypothetical protein